MGRFSNNGEITCKNFYKCTEASFKGCKIPKRKPNYTSYDNLGHVSSRYWYGKDKKGEYVIRASDHWVRLRNIIQHKPWKLESYRLCKSISTCFWHLKSTNIKERDDIININAGKAYLKDFRTLFGFDR